MTVSNKLEDNITKVKEGYFIMKKWVTNQEDITIINVHAFKKSFKIYQAKAD